MFVCLKTCWACVYVCVCGMTLNCVIVRTDQMSRETYGACSQMAKENEVSKTKKSNGMRGTGREKKGGKKIQGQYT